MKKIFITGIWGMLGYYLAQFFEKKYSVSGCDIIDSIFTPAFTFHKLDLANIEELKRLLDKEQPDCIIHTAAMINVDLCEKEPRQAMLMNGQVTEELAKIADSNGCRIVYISTDAVFNGDKNGAYTERDEVDPVNVYGKSKLAGENAILKTNNNGIVFRTNIFGRNIQSKVSFAEWVYNSLSSQEKITMFYDVVFTPIYIGYLAHLIDLAIEKEMFGLYHAAGGEICSKLDFGKALATHFSFLTETITPISVDEFSFTARRTKNMALDSSKIASELNFTLPGLGDSLNLFKKEMNSSIYKEHLNGSI